MAGEAEVSMVGEVEVFMAAEVSIVAVENPAMAAPMVRDLMGKEVSVAKEVTTGAAVLKLVAI